MWKLNFVSRDQFYSNSVKPHLNHSHLNHSLSWLSSHSPHFICTGISLDAAGSEDERRAGNSGSQTRPDAGPQSHPHSCPHPHLWIWYLPSRCQSPPPQAVSYLHQVLLLRPLLCLYFLSFCTSIGCSQVLCLHAHCFMASDAVLLSIMCTRSTLPVYTLQTCFVDSLTL